MLEKILELELGDPWKLDKDSTTAVVPLIRKPPHPKRRYTLIQESKEAKITDTGNIDKAKIVNPTDGNVFVRKGTLLEGDTQERGVVIGRMIMPQTETMVKIQCVHASKGIRAGTSFNAGGHVAPRAVMSSFMTGGSQSKTWRAASRDSKCYMAMSAIPATGFGSTHISADDLVGTLTETTKFKDEIEQALKQVPADLKNQVGIVIVNLNGIVGLEVFDHPESWSAFSKSITRNYADLLTEQNKQKLFSINMDQVTVAVEEFLETVKSLEPKRIVEGTYKIENSKIVGEFTTLDAVAVHLIVVKKEKEDPAEQINIHGRMPTVFRSDIVGAPQDFNLDTTSHVSFEDHDTSEDKHVQNFVSMKESLNVLRTLNKKPLTWTGIVESVKLSSRTLADRLQKGEQLGLITKSPYSNGRKRYKITEKGIEVLEATS